MSTVVDRLRDPEYTGENRCLPCTAVNVAIAVGLALAVGRAWAVPAGAVLFAVSLLAIAFKGYLVPGTPTLTKRYLPEAVLAYFDKAPEREHIDVADFDPEETLLSAGVVEPCGDVDDLCLVEAFRADWRAAMDGEADEVAALATELDVAPADLRVEDHGDGTVAFHDGVRVGQWESRAALSADVAAAAVLPDYVESWVRLPVAARSQLLGGLRAFLDRCPDCEGRVSAGTETVESCCREHEVVAVECDDCGARLLEAGYQ